MSIGTQKGPPIGVQKGPLCRCDQGCAWVSFERELWVSGPPERPSRVWRRRAAYPQRRPFSASGWQGQARFLKRQLSLPVSTMSQWWVRRSSSAVVIFASPNTLGHSPNARFVVTITEVCS